MIDPTEFDYYYRKKYSRYNLMVRFMLLSLTMFIFMLFFLTISTLSPHYAERLKLENKRLELEIQGLDIIPNLEEKIALIEKKTNELSTQIIENRLSAIEVAINKGDIKTQDIRNLQELNSEVIKLKTYLFDSTDDIIEFKTLQKNYQELKSNQERYAIKDDVRRDLDFQRTLLTICISIFGILITIFGTSWFLSWKMNKNQQKKVLEK